MINKLYHSIALHSASLIYDETYYTYFRVHVNHTGRVIWSFGGLFETSCDIDVTIFPFDSQTCPIVLENWAYNKEV